MDRAIFEKLMAEGEAETVKAMFNLPAGDAIGHARLIGQMKALRSVRANYLAAIKAEDKDED